MKALTLVAVLMFLGSMAPAEDPATTFQGFCDQWMQSLLVRQTDSMSHIRWETDEAGVRGDYVGYTPGHTCITKTGTESAPVGKIIYREVRYEKHGGTVAEAEQSPAKAVETTEVTEIFRYAGGKWIY
jgi:hypothetical protein